MADEQGVSKESKGASLIAREAFSQAEGLEGAIVATELPIVKPDRSSQKRRLETVYRTAQALIEQEKIGEARQYLLSYQWTSPQTVWWCDDEVRLAQVIEGINGMTRRREQGRSYACDFRVLAGRVVVVLMWRD